MPTIALEPVDQVEVLTVMDNTVDMLMASTPVAHRAPLRRDAFFRPRLRAEHGVSMLITVHYEGKKEVILFDAGTSHDGALHNMDVLEVKSNWIRMTDPTIGPTVPYLRYVSSALPNSPYSHLEKHEVILPVTHLFWTVWYPPNGLDCRCTVMGITESLLRQRGWTVTQDPQFRYLAPTPGFDFNIGKLLQERGEC
jgi:hypothetical protein